MDPISRSRDDEDRRSAPRLDEAVLLGDRSRMHLQGRWGKADILMVDTPHGPAIIKDFNRKSLIVRWYGRWQIRREASIYRRLSGLRGVPRYFGRIGKNAMAIEFIPGERISHWRRREIPPALFDRLWDLIQGIHDRGIVHIDLRKRDNILVDGAGEVFIIDFNASFRFVPGGAGARWFLPLLRRIDYFGFLKWKATLAPGQLTDTERSSLRKMSFLRRFWIFK
jgi:hypothetical protein